MSGPRLRVEILPGAVALPPALGAAFEAAGWILAPTGSPPQPGELVLRWAGGVEGFALEQPVGDATLVAGLEPPTDHGERARRVGAMGYVTPATAAAVAPLAHEALAREALGHAHRELVRLARAPEGDLSDLSALAALVERVAAALGADGVRAGLREDQQTVLAQHGPVPTWLTALPQRVSRVLVPDARHSPLTPPGATGAAVRLAVAGGPDGPQLQVALAWRAPRLLSPAELAVLDLLPLQAAPTLAPRRAASAARAELEVTHQLLAELRGPLATRRAAQRMLAVLGERAGVAAGILVSPDRGPPARVHLAALWARSPAVAVRLQGRLAGLCVAAEPPEARREALARALKPTGMVAQRWLELGDGQGGWLVWLDAPQAAEPRPLSPALRRFAAALLEQRAAAVAERAIEIHELPEEAEPADVLVRAAEALRVHTGACHALVSLPDGTDLVVRHVLPANGPAPALRHPVVPGSLTAEALEAGAPRRVLDVRSARDPAAARLAHSHLARLAEALKLDFLRSWLVVPVVDHAQRRVGAIKLLTGPAGPFLTEADQALAAAVAGRAALTMSRVARRARLDALNRLGERIAARDGQALADGMVDKLRAWFGRYAPPGGELFLVVRSTLPVTAETVLVAQASTGILDEVTRKALIDRSLSVAASPRWHEVGVEGRVATHYFRGAPIRLPGDDGLQGHLYLLRESPLDTVALQALSEVGREMSIILHHERFRVAWKLVIGRFRHALLGPVQGLQSAALALADEARKPAADPAVLEGFAEMIREEGAAIHRWREYERLFDEARPRIRLLHQALRPVVERCAQRFAQRFAARSAGFTVEWQVVGPVYLEFDETALDLVLSNLLDNAAKYVFGNRHAWVRVFGGRLGPRIEVGDIGTRIDPACDIYRTGERLTWEDPFRVISGQGIGLPLARALVEAHGGQLGHRCDPAGGTDETDPITRPHRVVFTVDLPRRGQRTEEER